MPYRPVLIAALLLCASLPERPTMAAFVRDNPNDGGATGLLRLLDETADRNGYVPSAPDDAHASSLLFERLLRGGHAGPVADGLGALGFAVGTLDDAIVVREASGQRTGKGIFVLRPDHTAHRPVLIQAPHRFTDLETGRIAARLFAEGGLAAAAWNTIPRSYRDGDAVVDADLAHAPTSHLDAFTRAFARVHPDGRVVQIHGFEQRKRTSKEGLEADVIVSSGGREPSREAHELARCLEAVLRPARVLLFPVGVEELGATTNANAASLRELGHDGFLHVEISRRLRSRLASKFDLRSRMLRCLK